MTLQQWILKRYLALLKRFGNREFSRAEAEALLKDEGLSIKNLNEVFGILVKEGLIEMTGKGKNTKYKIVENIDVKGTTKDELIRALKSAADIIRNHDYRVLLLFLIFKEISDKWNLEVKKLMKKENLTKEEAWDVVNSTPGLFHLYDENTGEIYTWDEVTKDKTNLGENLIKAFNKIAELNPKLSDLKYLVDRFNLKVFVSGDSYPLLVRVISIFDRLDLSKVDYDTLGGAYDWILYYFAKDKAKAGEIYTPREVIKAMVKILDIQESSDVLDPACGSAAMLIEAFEHVKERGKNPRTLKLVGQELNHEAVAIGKLNLMIHGIENFEIYQGDSLKNPQFSEVDYVLANPPWNLKYELNLTEKLKEIYKYGVTPKQSADWLWVQLMLHFSRKKVAVILDAGSLFRGGKEGLIREQIVKDDLIDTIILLPPKLFYNTGAPGVILIFNKNKDKKRKGKILFINASKEFEKHPDVRKLNILSDKNIKNIVKAYNDYKTIEGFTKVVTFDEIKKNDFNLNVSLYVPQFEEEEKIDVDTEWKELKKIDSEITKLEEKLNKFLKVIN